MGARANSLMLFESYTQEQELLVKYIKQQIKNSLPLHILEAGCGRRWPLNLTGCPYVLTGIDVDEKAIEYRINIAKDLHEVIVGDLHSVDLPKNSYDVIYSSFVLEHLQDAEGVLDRFSVWLKPGGLLILRIPDRDSVYGFVTRLTPFWLHVIYKRYLLGQRNAGKAGFGPYPTVHEHVVSREGIQYYCRRHSFCIKEEFGNGLYMCGVGIVPKLTRMFVIVVSLLSLGKLRWRHNNLTYIIEKI